MSKATVLTVFGYIVAAAIIGGGVWAKTERAGWTLAAALIGAAITVAVLRLIIREAAEAKKRRGGGGL